MTNEKHEVAIGHLGLAIGHYPSPTMPPMPEPDTSHHPHHAELINPDGSWKYTNALIDQTSPYLRQHAHNPVDWLPWGEDAFELARQRDVPIFLSIGYSTCYWCHVMERQVFEHPQIAAQMNELFVNIKVDREERPDIDDIYMTATQVMTRRGGWPMSVFLTPPSAKSEDNPGLRPFWCGTYIPPEPMHGMASFPQVLSGLSNAWLTQRSVVIEQADQVADIVQQQLSADAAPTPIDLGIIDQCVAQIASTHDAEHGGFGDAPKFPQPTTTALLLAVQQRTGDETLGKMIEHALDRMARGGMFDQIGGGFHRYSADEKWLVPHFEKMLYDNGQLAELYIDFYGTIEDEQSAYPFGWVAKEICDYVIREMTDETGAFWSAQDAEVDGHEGGNYLWTPEQIDAAFGDNTIRAALAKLMYGVDLGPNFTDPHVPDAEPTNVLFLPDSLETMVSERGLGLDYLRRERNRINHDLLTARDQRPQPATDDKVLTSWNGMMIAGFAKVGAALGQPHFIEAAARSADAILAHLAVPEDQGGGLYRSFRDGAAQIPAFLDDYAHFIHGLLALHRYSDADDNYLDHAVRLTGIVIERFAHEHGGYYDTLADQPDLFVRTRSSYDGAVPTGNSQMIHNLIDLAEMTGDHAYAQRAGRDLQSFASALARQSVGMTHMIHALLKLLETAPQTLELEDTADAQSGVAVSITPNPATVADGVARVMLTLDIAEGLHLTAAGDDDDAAATTLMLLQHEGVTLDINWPQATMKQYAYADRPLPIYEGQIALPFTLCFAGEVPAQAQLQLGYQPCTDSACHRRAVQTLTLRLEQP